MLSLSHEMQPTATSIQTAATDTLSVIGREFAALGLMPATSGNLSLRLSAETALMTRSGVEKGTLSAHDFLVVSLALAIPAGASAEAPLHAERYRNAAGVGCVLHVHSRAAAVLSRLALGRGQNSIDLQGWELQKALTGHVHPQDSLRIPVFANDQDTQALSSEVAARLATLPAAQAYLLAGHGLYAWGRDAVEARRHVLALDVLLQCELDVLRAL